ncbi:DUF2971 domain-containing protein [Herbivorax sp. ANBcel31]|uniref:DUF2971 domain-containing protein n=1 Tax=Herbivorax sp. ANBcel31 TaxID=3069754 RepID=UPI0027AE3864|nr:DUF2971 domain-containing protein [Herbivorax sp. ANBcel31]MDQ2087994.1 DUF2971 domain-containing protein [Herbivorax sp. ANBcel31]
MSSQIIWRYMSLAKYIELLRSQSLYFPKASLFDDATEGKWAIHSFLNADKIRLLQLKRNREILDGILKRSGNNDTKLYQEVTKVLTEEKINTLLKGVLDSFNFYYIHNRSKFKGNQYLKSLVDGWKKRIEEYPETKKKSISQVLIHRESTYINCWYRADEMSLAMWQLFGGGEESIAIRTTIGKLKQVLKQNDNYLENKGYESDISEVDYISNLKEPNEEKRDKIMSILCKGKDATVGQFSIKPKEYEYEKEVRGIIYPIRSPYDKVIDPDPDINGFSIPIVININQSSVNQLSQFIDEVHIHPLQGENSIIFKVIKELHKLFDIEEIPIKSNMIEAFGKEVDF